MAFEKYQFEILLLNNHLQQHNTLPLEIRIEFIYILERVTTQGIENGNDNLSKENILFIAKCAKLIRVPPPPNVLEFPNFVYHIGCITYRMHII